MKEITARTIEETEKAAADFVAFLGKIKNIDTARIVALHGDLGAGKTAFTKGVAKALGVENDVTSPTFVIEKIYRLEDALFDHLIHIDAYRLDDASELLTLGWKDISENPKNLILIEWPEKVSQILPLAIIHLHFLFVDEKTRKIKIEDLGLGE